MRVGWLNDVTNWLRDQFRSLWDALVAFLNDLIVTALEAVLELVALAFEALPVPEFVQGQSVGAMLGQAGPVVGWLASTMQLGTASSLMVSAYAFRALRKAVTGGRW